MTPEQALNELGIDFRRSGEHHHVNDGWIGFDCPTCSPRSGRYRLGLNLYGLYLSCWVCGQLPLLRTLAEISGQSTGTVANAFAGVAKASQTEKRTRGRLQVPLRLRTLQTQHTKYLEGRGYNVDQLRKVWKLKGLCHDGHPAWHVWIPIHHRGEIVSWTARSISPDNTRRYYNARPDEEALSAKSVLYGMDHARHTVIVHEGPADVWATGPGALATMGVAYTREQLRLLSHYPTRYVCLDAEPDAQRRARHLCDDLSALPGRTFNLVLDSGKDAGSASEAEIRQLRGLLR